MGFGWLCWAGIAGAVEPAAAEPPLAIPAAGPAPRAPGPPSLAVPAAIPGRAWQAWREQRLVVRPLVEWSVAPGWGPGWWGPYGWGGAWVTSEDRLAVFQGSVRLDVPELLTALGDAPGRLALERRIRRQQRAGRAWTTLGFAGLATSLVGLVGMDRAWTWDQARDWSTVTWVGSAAMVGGFVIGAFPTERARHLQLDPERTLHRDELERRVDAHNDRLARSLGIDPERPPVD